MKENTRQTMKFFLKHVRPFWLLASALWLFLTVGIIAEMYWPIVLKDFFNLLATPAEKNLVVAGLYSSLILIAIIEAVNWVSMRIFDRCNIYFQSKIMSNIANECFEYLHGHSYNFFNSNFTGALVKKVNRMVTAFESIADKIVFTFYPLTLRLILIISILYWINFWLGTILLAWTIIFLTINYLLAKYRLKYDLERSKADTKVTAILADTITNSVNIKLFAALPFEINNFKNVSLDWFKKVYKSWMIDINIDAVQAAFMVMLEIGMLWIAIVLWQQDQVTVGDFFLIQAYLLDLFRQLWGLGRSVREMYRSLSDAEEMTLILIKPHEVQTSKRAKKLKVTAGRVRFDNVQFSYHHDENAVIKKLSFFTKPGEKIALIGPSGGGKSTITKLMLRLLDIQKGKISIDDQNIAHVTQDSLRANIAMVPQDPILFHRTLMENIRYANPNASDEEVFAASKMAHCHEFISGFAKGYNTFVGERGVKLSGGQRQRVAIARAILMNTKILILDEATSSLDSESESLIQNALEALMRNRTTFIIAHRLSTIMQADRILVLKNGQIIEEGGHKDLINKKGSLYAKLWDIQAGGFLREE